MWLDIRVHADCPGTMIPGQGNMSNPDEGTLAHGQIAEVLEIDCLASHKDG